MRQRPFQDPEGSEAPATPPASGCMAPRKPGPEVRKESPLSKPCPGPGELKFSRAKHCGKRRLFNHMIRHSLSYLFPASGFPPLANRTEQGWGGRGRGAVHRGGKHPNPGDCGGLGLPPLVRLRSPCGWGWGEPCNHQRWAESWVLLELNTTVVPSGFQVPVWGPFAQLALSAACGPCPATATTPFGQAEPPGDFSGHFRREGPCHPQGGGKHSRLWGPFPSGPADLLTVAATPSYKTHTQTTTVSSYKRCVPPPPLSLAFAAPCTPHTSPPGACPWSRQGPAQRAPLRPPTAQTGLALLRLLTPPSESQPRALARTLLPPPQRRSWLPKLPGDPVVCTTHFASVMSCPDPASACQGFHPK